MEPETLIDSLVTEGVLVESSESELTFTEAFLDRVDHRTDQITTGDEDWIRAFTDSVRTGAGHADSFVELATTHPRLVGTYWALDEYLHGASFTELIQLLLTLDCVQNPPARTSGTPEGFLAVRGDRLVAFLPFIRYGLVYVWRDECDPCDEMVRQFEEVDEARLTDALRLSVYGPAWAEILSTELDVAAGPTTLFVANGRVDSRLIGAHPASIISEELEKAETALQ